jgi:hypothetical protein
MKKTILIPMFTLIFLLSGYLLVEGIIFFRNNEMCEIPPSFSKASGSYGARALFNMPLNSTPEFVLSAVPTSFKFICESKRTPENPHAQITYKHHEDVVGYNFLHGKLCEVHVLKPERLTLSDQLAVLDELTKKLEPRFGVHKDKMIWKYEPLRDGLKDYDALNLGVAGLHRSFGANAYATLQKGEFGGFTLNVVYL